MRYGLERVGRAALVGGRVLRVLPHPRRYTAAMLEHAYVFGVRSLPLVLVMAVLGGAVTSQQGGANFTGGLPLWVAGSLSVAAVLTELGPVLTGLVLVGRVGASIAAELASMRVTEQIDALQALGHDPVEYLVVPRVVAGVVVTPALVVLADAAGMISAWLVALLAVDGLTTAEFLYGVRFAYRPFLLVYSLVKAAAFGATITFLACFVGLAGRGGARGVGRTTTAAVVATTLAIMILDVLMVPLLRRF